MTKYTVTVAHDKGKTKIATWAENEQSAIEQVMKAENCPRSAIVSVKPPRLTIHDIKELTKETAPHFFTKETLRFFGQTMGSFSVKMQHDGRTRISAPMKDRQGNHMGYTVRFFNPTNNTLERE